MGVRRFADEAVYPCLYKDDETQDLDLPLDPTIWSTQVLLAWFNHRGSDQDVLDSFRNCVRAQTLWSINQQFLIKESEIDGARTRVEIVKNVKQLLDDQGVRELFVAKDELLELVDHRWMSRRFDKYVRQAEREPTRGRIDRKGLREAAHFRSTASKDEFRRLQDEAAMKQIKQHQQQEREWEMNSAVKRSIREEDEFEDGWGEAGGGRTAGINLKRQNTSEA
ncbi:hypothetical protein V5O48_013079 [Marasmius crinis-equi]|uniref:Uncharacterized protein n=1 Tax=Marasmius crinis-equi TaxID=585013 RepID=A0ABR3F137_9AGAR